VRYDAVNAMLLNETIARLQKQIEALATDRPSLFFRSAMVSVPRVYSIEFRD
jgi:putative transposon-encoded protein